MVVVRARDVATRSIQNVGNAFGLLGASATAASNNLFQVGAAMTAMGVVSTAAGIKVLSFLDDSVGAFMSYEEEAATALTQTKGLNISLEDLLDLGRDVARDLPVPFEEIQPTLFDIFSTLDTLNLSLEETELITRAFAKAAVAGNVEMRDASRATMAIMNAFGLEAKDVNRVLDIQFQMVKSGTGTYGEFASTIGLAIPAFSNADQSVESLAGAVAFLTKQGLSASRSATSAARAMELIAKPASVSNLEAMGVAVKDADGNFNDLQTIMNDLAFDAGWAELTGPERAKAFKETFGTGTIQARRFFDSVIPNVDTYNSVMDSMGNSTGAMEEAFAIMGDTGAAKAQLLSNQYEVLKTEIGQELLPAKIKLMEAAIKLFEWWENLSDGTKRLIIRIVSVIGVFLTVLGIVVTLIGVFAIFAALLGGVAIAVKVLVIASAIFGVIAAAAFLIIDNWETVGPVLEDVWNTITDAAQTAWTKLQEFWSWLQSTFGPVFEEIFGIIQVVADGAWGAIGGASDAAQPKLEEFQDWIQNTFAPAFGDVFGGLATGIESGASTAQDKLAEFREWLENDFAEQFNEVFTRISDRVAEVWEPLSENSKEIFSSVRDSVVEAWDAISERTEKVGGILRGLWDWITGTLAAELGPIFDQIKDSGSTVWDLIGDAAEIFGDTLGDLWDFVSGTFIPGFLDVWNTLREEVVKVIDQLIKGFERPGPVLTFLLGLVQTNFSNMMVAVRTALDVITSSIEGNVSLMLAIWDRFGSTVISVVEIAWNFIVQMFESQIQIILGWVRFFIAVFTGEWGDAWDAIKDILAAGWDAIFAIFDAAWALLVVFFTNLLPNIAGFFVDAATILVSAGSDIITGLLVGALETVGNIWDFFFELGRGVVNAVKDFFGIGSPATKMVPLGIDIILGLLRGLVNTLPLILTFMIELPGKAFRAVGNVKSTLTSKGKDLLQGMVDGHVSVFTTIMAPWWNALPSSVREKIGSVVNTIKQKGRDLMSGLLSGAKQWWNDKVKPWLDIARKVRIAVGSLSSTLTQIGRDVINGLLDGMKEAWGSVSSWLSDRGHIIPGIKGPPEKDKVLLNENGQLIMQGLLKGLESGWVDVVRFLAMASGELGMFGTDLGDTMMDGLMPRSTNGDLASLTGDANRVGINIENATFGDERVVDDLDWWTRTEGAGV